MELLPRPFLQTTQWNSPSSVTFPAFSLYLIIAFLTFTLNPFDCNAPFHAFSLSFRPPLVALMAAVEFQHFVPRQIKCPDNYMKIHFASAFPRQCFCRGWQDFILRALLFTLATSGKTSTRSKLVSCSLYSIFKYCCAYFVAQILLYAMQCAIFSRQKLCFKNNFGCFFWVQK